LLWSIANGSRECAPDDRLGDAFRDERFKRCLVIPAAKRSSARRKIGRGDANWALRSRDPLAPPSESL